MSHCYQARLKHSSMFEWCYIKKTQQLATDSHKRKKNGEWNGESGRAMKLGWGSRRAMTTVERFDSSVDSSWTTAIPADNGEWFRPVRRLTISDTFVALSQLFAPTLGCLIGFLLHTIGNLILSYAGLLRHFFTIFLPNIQNSCLLSMVNTHKVACA